MYDLVIIGCGPAGVKAGAQASNYGFRTAIVERGRQIGGAMVVTGTLPSKTLRETALYIHGYRQRDLFGIRMDMSEDITVRNFMFRKHTIVERQEKALRTSLEEHGIDLYHGRAFLADPHTVRVEKQNGQTVDLKAGIICIATGSRPRRPPTIPFDDHYIFDSDTILDLDSLPTSMTIFGGGVIACEYACIFSLLGIDVHLVDHHSNIMPFIDSEIRDRLINRMEANGVTFHSGVRYHTLQPEGQGITVHLENGCRIPSEKLLFCVGRTPSSHELGLENLSVPVDEKGCIIVNQHYQTSIPHIYAVGDVIGPPALASTSMEQGRLAMCHAFDLTYKKKLASILPFGIYTIPEISMVGLTEHDAKAFGLDVEVGQTTFDRHARGQIIGELDGMLKLVFSSKDQIVPLSVPVPDARILSENTKMVSEYQLLGVHIIGESATELIHSGLSCMYYHGTIDYFIQSVFNYPTLSDAYKYAAYNGLRKMGFYSSDR